MYYRGIANMLTTGEVARRLGVHPSTLRRWSDKGIVKCYRIGPQGQRRFRQEDVSAVLVARAARKH